MFLIKLYYLKLLFGVVVVFLLLLSCSDYSAEQQIETRINDMQRLISDKSLSDFMNYFALDFIGNKKLTRNNLRQLIFFQFQRNRNIETYQWQADIKIENNIAEVEIYVLVSGSDKILPDRGNGYKIISLWKKIGDEWLIVKASWKQSL